MRGPMSHSQHVPRPEPPLLHKASRVLFLHTHTRIHSHTRPVTRMHMLTHAWLPQPWRGHSSTRGVRRGPFSRAAKLPGTEVTREVTSLMKCDLRPLFSFC